MRTPKMYRIKVTNLIYDEAELIRMYFLAITNCGGEYERWNEDGECIILKYIHSNEINRLKEFINHIEYARKSMEVTEEE